MFPIFIFGPGIAFIIGWLVKVIIGKETTPLRGKSIGVLGMPEAGKTQFYKTFKGESYENKEATGVDDYPPFTVSIKDRKINVQSGRDIGGGEVYIKNYYSDFIQNKDIIFFIFNVKRYIEDTKYCQEVRARLDYIWSQLGEKSGAGEDQSILIPFVKERFVLIGSHLDCLSDDEKKNARKKLDESVSGRDYENMFQNNMFLLDLTNRDELLTAFEKAKLFG